MPSDTEKYTYVDYAAECADVYLKHSGEADPWRFGQSAFNVLFDRRPDLSEQVRTTELDPFYQDDRLTDFLDWVKEHWGNNGLMNKP